MFPAAGFTDTLAAHAAAEAQLERRRVLREPLRGDAEPARLDALIVRVVMAVVVRSRWAKALWLAWPPWVWFSVMATGNHFWLDIAAGILVARSPRRSSIARGGVSAARQHERQDGVHGGRARIAARSMTGLARTRVTPNMLTAAGVTLCAVGAVLVYFEYRNELLFFWTGALAFVVGSVLDILDGALARAGGKQTPFGGFLDSTLDRVGEGLMLGAIALVFMRDGKELALALAVAAIGGSFLVPYARAKAEGSGSRATSDRLARRARDRDLGRARTRAVGRTAVGDRRPRRDGVVHGAAADPARPPRASRPRLIRSERARCPPWRGCGGSLRSFESTESPTRTDRAR